MQDSHLSGSGWQATYSLVLSKICFFINSLNYGMLGNIITLMTLVVFSLAFCSRISKTYSKLKRRFGGGGRDHDAD